MNITVVGAGNMGLAMTGYIAGKKEDTVCLFTGKDIGTIEVYDIEKCSKFKTDDYICTDDPNVAFKKADVIFVTYPAFLRRKFIEEYSEYINEGTYLGFVPGYGGAEYLCDSLIKRGVNILGFQRVPYVARAIKDKIFVANIISRKQKLFVGVIPRAKTNEICKIVEHLLDIPVQPLKEYLSITLAPSNPLLHTVGVYNVFKDRDSTEEYSKPLKFYEEWNDDSSRLLFEYDTELQKICKALEPLDMSEVVSLPIYYESPTPEAMTRKLKSIEAFKSVMVPLEYNNGKYNPDLNSRMFIEDFPFGVCVIKEFSNLTGISTPAVDMLLNFYWKFTGHKYFNEDGTYTDEIINTGVPGRNGVDSIQKIISFYKQ